ncbi:hypothetical protein AHF37_01362 [Paragonimus kellicotti]|nr:hypothetical protein AHF37_01362 [Paragonimus kellicotti]
MNLTLFMLQLSIPFSDPLQFDYRSDEVHWSKDDDVKQENNTSNQSVITDACNDEGNKNGIAVSANGTLQMESLTIEADTNDETEEFVQASRSNSNRRQKQKPKSFAD